MMWSMAIQVLNEELHETGFCAVGHCSSLERNKFRSTYCIYVFKYIRGCCINFGAPKDCGVRIHRFRAFGKLFKFACSIMHSQIVRSCYCQSETSNNNFGLCGNTTLKE
mmetsp:Transcript_13262/g.28139  ORF Transcript_13262/g.28139 Transcript_13262/m.28139 type:complete len:109 (+) Transcript_13262:821-1147(+)